MATKPIVRIPLWASAGTIIDPGASEEAAGWVAGERAPAAWANWLPNALGQWAEYFEDVTDENVADLALRLLKAGDAMTGDLDINNASGITVEADTVNDKAGLEVDGAAADFRQLVWKAGNAYNKIRVYALLPGLSNAATSFEVTYNAQYQSATNDWTADNTGRDAWRLTVGQDTSSIVHSRLKLEHQDSTGADWSVWPDSSAVLRTRPASSGLYSNSVHREMLCRAQAYVDFPNLGPGTITGYGIQSVVLKPGDTQTLVVTLDNAMAGTKYCPVISYAGGGAGNAGDWIVRPCQPTNWTTTTFECQLWDYVASGAVDMALPGTGAFRFTVAVFGEQ